ncbi:helix-turn-helix domain-containing protein [Streptomyces sp. NBC_01262]|uniref:helix-turn-helix domain-containing protein n=1 Tax=Streptomyces sp. NBC_01262 TaxID=2903803 RepID=UPI002E36E37C|nr:helix-turn-helix transcriptional regulator [Streptomyces sp. NBC_01262]
MTAGPTTRRRQLGVSLRRLRERKGLSLEEAGALVGLSKATLSRYETKEGQVKWPLVDALCREYGASAEERATLVELAKNAKVQGWWQSYTDAIPERTSLLITLENEATRLDHFSCVYVPGLLQTQAYAETIHRAVAHDVAEDVVARSVAVRMKRQEILTRENPVEQRVVLDESAIRRRVGGSEVMQEQISHLVECAERPNITLQVLPFESGAHAAAMDSFLILVGADPSLDVVYMENLTVSLYVEKGKEVAKYHQAFDYLRQQALGADASLELLKKAVREI